MIVAGTHGKVHLTTEEGVKVRFRGDQFHSPSGGPLPVILQPLRKDPRESPHAFAERAVRQIEEGLIRQTQDKNNQTEG
ncbi:MAG: hypothetical protein VB980_05660 [Opitutales bacterium]